nr:flavin reductase [Planosporangium flavigriseum]
MHIPIRPAWICAGCSQEWPCHTRRAQFLAEFERATVSLGLLMGSHLVQASQDLPAARAGELYVRFLGWIGRPPRRDNRGPWIDRA